MYCINRLISEELHTRIPGMDIIYKSTYVAVIVGEGSATSSLAVVAK
jgi:hypothetical protein